MVWWVIDGGQKKGLRDGTKGKERKEGPKKRKVYIYTKKDGEEEGEKKARKGNGRWKKEKRKKIDNTHTHTHTDKKRKQGRVKGRREGEQKCSRSHRFSCVIWFPSYRIHLGFTVLSSAALWLASLKVLNCSNLTFLKAFTLCHSYSCPPGGKHTLPAACCDNHSNIVRDLQPHHEFSPRL